MLIVSVVTFSSSQSQVTCHFLFPTITMCEFVNVSGQLSKEGGGGLLPCNLFEDMNSYCMLPC